MLAKLISSDRKKEHLFPPFDHSALTRYKERTEVVLIGVVGGKPNIKILLPEDGDVVYIENDNGKTVETYRHQPELVTKVDKDGNELDDKGNVVQVAK